MVWRAVSLSQQTVGTGKQLTENNIVTEEHVMDP